MNYSYIYESFSGKIRANLLYYCIPGKKCGNTLEVLSFTLLLSDENNERAAG
jgi:hypothetical protein